MDKRNAIHNMKSSILAKSACIIAVAALFIPSSLNAWGGLGHKTVIAIAQRHLTEKAKQNIATVMPYDMKTDAVWMDKHRRDKEIAFTSDWHVFCTRPGDHRYDPSARIPKGDCIYGVEFACYNLEQWKELSDSARLMNLRMLIHWVGDMHCPAHSYVWYPGGQKWSCVLNGVEYPKFHGVYDNMPEMIWGKKSADKIAEELDNASAKEYKAIIAGSVRDWAKDCADRSAKIYDINPPADPRAAEAGFTVYEGPLPQVLDPETVEKSRDIVCIQLRNAGYRLARLLNEYFGE